MNWLVPVVVVVLALVALVWVLQRRLIYYPAGALADPTVELPRVEMVDLRTEDGLTLGAWFMPPQSPSSGTVIVFNGNAGNRSHRIPLGRALASRGYGVLLVDYRGYGGNPGRPTEAGLAADARAARDFLLTREEVDSSRLAYFGESLGAAVAVGLAIEHVPAALVLRSPFTSLAGIGAVHYPFLPVSLMLLDDYDVVDRIREVEAPLLVIAGSADRIVPPDQTRAVHEAANEPRELVVVEGAGHNDPALLTGEEMIEEMARFFETHLRAASN